MKKKEREREKETSRNRSDARAYITRGPSATFTDSSSRFLSSKREREKRREASKTILSIDIDEKRITYLKYTREHVTRSPTVSWKVFFQTLSLFHSSSNDFILTSRWGTMEIARR